MAQGASDWWEVARDRGSVSSATRGCYIGLVCETSPPVCVLMEKNPSSSCPDSVWVLLLDSGANIPGEAGSSSSVVVHFPFLSLHPARADVCCFSALWDLRQRLNRIWGWNHIFVFVKLALSENYRFFHQYGCLSLLFLFSSHPCFPKEHLRNSFFLCGSHWLWSTI